MRSPMIAAKHSRRNFFASLAALSAASLMPREAFADDNSSELHNTAPVDRGIAPDSDDFALRDRRVLADAVDAIDFFFP